MIINVFIVVILFFKNCTWIRKIFKDYKSFNESIQLSMLDEFKTGSV